MTSGEQPQSGGPPLVMLSVTIEVAQRLHLMEVTEELMRCRQALESSEFHLIVLGRFKNGKTALLNSLLGREILPMRDLPTTARLTTIRYGEQPTVTMIMKDGKRVPKSLAWFLDNSSLKPSEAQNISAFGNVVEFELTYPFENGKGGLVLLDSPGIGDGDISQELIASRAKQCDAAIMLYRTDRMLSELEREFVEDMRRRGLTSYFSVVNRWHGRTVDERLKGYVWYKLVTDLEGGPSSYAGQDFAAHNIYFVDALAALQGRLAGDEVRVAESGLPALEQAIGKLVSRRRQLHQRRVLEKIDYIVTTNFASY